MSPASPTELRVWLVQSGDVQQGVRITGCTLADLSKDRNEEKGKKNALSKIPFYNNRNEENNPSIIILHSSLSV